MSERKSDLGAKVIINLIAYGGLAALACALFFAVMGAIE